MKCSAAGPLSGLPDLLTHPRAQVEQFEADIEAEASVQKGKTKSPR
jgi:hypothetical protein